MSTAQIITPNSNDEAFTQIDALAQPVVLQIPIGDGLFKTEVLGGLTKIQTVASVLLSGILSTRPHVEEKFQQTGDEVGLALTYAHELLRRSNEPDPPMDVEVFSGDQ